MQIADDLNVSDPLFHQATHGFALVLRSSHDILRIMQNKSSSILPILRTDTQRDLLIELFFLTDRPRTLSDLAKAIGVDQTTVMREVNRLLESGVVVEQKVGRARTVAINEASPFAGPLRQMIRVVYQPLENAQEAQHRSMRSRHAFPNAEPSQHERRPLPSSRRRR